MLLRKIYNLPKRIYLAQRSRLLHPVLFFSSLVIFNKQVYRAIILIVLSLPFSILAEELDNKSFLLLGIIINKHEKGAIEVLQEGDGDLFWLALKDLQKFTGIDLEPDGQALRFITPIGVVELPTRQLNQYDGINYISSQQMLDTLSIKTRFNKSLYALELEVPWRPGAPLTGRGTKQGNDSVVLNIDIPAPAGTFSFMRFRGQYSHLFKADQDDWINTLDAGGRILSGSWLLGLRNSNDEQIYLDRFFWNRNFDQAALRLGTNTINLNPLLHNYRYTGAQAAFNNKGIGRFVDFESSLNQDSFLSEDIAVQQDIIRNDGPPGGIAELRFNDRPVMRVRISLNGQYEFNNIPQVQGEYQSVLIYLYEHDIHEIPIEIINYTRSLVSEMLSPGEVLLRAGAGQVGNSIYSEYPTSNHEFSGFFQARYGLTDRLTVQGIVQTSLQNELELLLGARLSLGENWAWAIDVSTRDGVPGVSSELLGFGQNWDFRLRSTQLEAGYGSNENRKYDHNLRTFYNLFDSFRPGLVGRYYKNDNGDEIKFIWPAFYWNPFSNLATSAVPNLNGKYRATIDYYPDYRHRVSATYDTEQYTALYNFNINSYLSFQTAYEYNSFLDRDRIYIRSSWYIDDNRYNYLQGGISYNQKEPGFFLSWNKIITPGIELRFEYFDHYRLFSIDEGDRKLFLSLRLDFANTGKRIAPVDYRRINFARGGISGAIVDQNGEKIAVDNVGIRINGRRLPQYQAGGSFYVGNLKPGVYTVEIDEGHLPIEYVPLQRSYKVEVAESAVTGIDFVVRKEYGIAGRVTDFMQQPIASVTIEINDSTGNKIAQVTTGVFGYYRIDGLVPGYYTVRVKKIDAKLLGEDGVLALLNVEIVDDYLFDQNIQIQSKNK